MSLQTPLGVMALDTAPSPVSISAGGLETSSPPEQYSNAGMGRPGPAAAQVEVSRISGSDDLTGVRSTPSVDDEGASDDDLVGTSRSPSPALTVSNGPTSPPSVTDSLAPSGSALASPNPTTISSSSPPPPGMLMPAPKADVGFGTLHAEEEIKKALTAKDRMFVLMLGKEFEAFIGRVHRGEYVTRVQSTQASTSTSTSLLDSLGPSKKIDVAAVSKYQRMLTYKLAEWYGLRAAPGIDGSTSMVVGVVGSLEPKSTALRIATLVPEATAPQTQQFRIMQRDALSVTDEDGGGSRATSVSAGDDGTESSSGPRGKTLEERTLAYALARKRIIGDDDSRDDDSVSASASQPRSRQTSRYGGDDDDDMDMVPRRPFQPEYEYVYPSLYHPSHEGQAAPNMAGQGVAPGVNPGYGGFQGMQPPYQGYMQPPQMGFDPKQGGYAMAPYPGTQQFPGQVPMTSYGQPWPQPPMAPGMMGGGQMQGMMIPGQGWYPTEMVMAPQQGPSMMPMIPQGMPYAPSFGYGPQQQQQQGRPPHPPLAQPTPIRPGLDPLSSTASSISSRSYQDVHSRPHSRGSTTSTRSAASSVRLGAMYPTGQQTAYGYRQKAVKSSQGSFSSSIKPTFETRRNGRQSPASTTSSRSSRRASSIHIQQPLPGQHPLPQRPDWAANNVPYHPSPMPLQPGAADPSTSDFPPLHRGAAVVSAEPMQVEKVKMRPSNATVWNGTAARCIQQPGQQQPAAGAGGPADMTPQQLSPAIYGPPAVSILPNPIKPPTPVQPLPPVDVDPDFPRRMPSTSTPSLYDPSASAQPRPARQPPAAQMPPPVAALPALSPAPSAPVPAGNNSAHTPEIPAAAVSPSSDVGSDAIEARLAALNVKSAPMSPGTSRQPPSYAKIVRRD